MSNGVSLADAAGRVLTDAGAFACHQADWPSSVDYLLGPEGDGVQQWLDEGDPLPGDPTETVKYTCDRGSVSTNFSGEYAFTVELVPGSKHAILVVDETETYRLVAHADPEGPYSQVGLESINRAGDVAFGAAGVTGSAMYGPDGSGGFELRLLNGTPIADIPGSSFSFAGAGAMLLSDGGDLIFDSRIRNTPVAEMDYGAFRMNLDDTVELIYREGDPVPSSAGVFDEFSLPAANIDGDAIVLAGGNAFVSRPGSPLELILATGQLLEVAPGDFRSVSSVFGHHTASEHHLNRRGFNNDGDAVFRLRFSDGDEAVVRTNVNAPVVPVLPVGTWLLGMALLGASGVGLVRRRASA